MYLDLFSCIASRFSFVQIVEPVFDDFETFIIKGCVSHKSPLKSAIPLIVIIPLDTPVNKPVSLTVAQPSGSHDTIEYVINSEAIGILLPLDRIAFCFNCKVPPIQIVSLPTNSTNETSE